MSKRKKKKKRKGKFISFESGQMLRATELQVNQLKLS